MADTRSVRPIGLIRHLEFTLDGHMFTISAVVLRLEAPGEYPMFTRTSMVANREYQATLAAEHDLVPKR